MIILVSAVVLAVAELNCAGQLGKEGGIWIDELRRDHRLNKAVTLNFSAGPKAVEVLRKLEVATGAPMSLSQTGDPVRTFGGTDISNVPVWKVMEHIALAQVVDGRWEKKGDGYVLQGKQIGLGHPKSPGAEERENENEAYEKQIAAAAEARADFAKYHPLGLDERLHKKLTVLEKHPKLADLLARLSAATGLRFTLADELSHHDPDLGHLQLKNARAYLVMEIIAERDLDGGRWEKTEDGYRLTGTSRVLRPEPPPSPWRLVGAIALFALAVGIGVFLVVRWRKNATAGQV